MDLSITTQNIGKDRSFTAADRTKFENQYATQFNLWTGHTTWCWATSWWIFTQESCQHPSLEQLGEGSFGIVYKFVNSAGQNLAIKTFTKPGRDNRNEWQTEVEQLQKVSGLPGIVHMIESFSWGWKNPIYAIVLPLAEGGDVWEPLLVDSSVLENEYVQKGILSDIITGLRSLQGKRLVSRDYKPNNLLYFINDGHLRVEAADMGLLVKEGERGKQYGTPQFMAMESVGDPRGEVRMNAAHRSFDIWGAGLSLYHFCGARQEPPKRVGLDFFYLAKGNPEYRDDIRLASKMSQLYEH